MPTRVSLFVAVTIGLLLSTSAWADIINVPADQPTIQAGIDAASDGDEVVVAPGTYNEVINFNAKAITLRSSDGADVTTIDGTDLDSSVVKCVSGEGTGTVLDGFTITGGTGTTWVHPEGNTYLVGGGMFNENSSPTLTDCTFSWNSIDEFDYSDSLGGGMFNVNSSPTLTDCTFNENTAGHTYNYGRGGGMYNENSSPTLTNCTFSENTAGHSYNSGYGGGMFNENSSPTLTDCTISGNWAAGGGGVVNWHSSSPVLTNCTFTENRARFYTGGGMSNRYSSNPVLTNCTFSGEWAYYGGGMFNSGSNPTLINCTFTDNEAGYLGGGLDNHDGSSPTLINCAFSANRARRLPYYGYGGGMSNRGSSTPTLTNCTFSGNWAITGGGGMYNGYPSSSPTLTNCAFSGNSTDENGGGMYNRNSGPTLTNCTFSANSAAINGDAMACDSPDQLYPSTVSLTNCILWDGGDEIWNNDGSAITITYSDIQGWTGGGVGNIAVDPLFVDPDGDDDIPGTEDDNVRPSPDSPCIDAGDSTAVPPDTADLDDDNDTTEPIPFDLDGNPRFVNDLDAQDTGVSEGGCPIVDMGAYEFQDGTAECCPADFDGDGTVGASDLAQLLGSWGPYGPCPPFDAADFNEDCGVNAADLAELLGDWGPCD